MSQIQLTTNQFKSVQEFCKLNKIENIDEFITKCFTSGFNIEKYGLLNSGVKNEKLVEKEVIVEKRVEVPVEVIKEVVKVEYIEVEKPVEKIVEVIKEVVKIEYVEVPVEVVKYVETPVEIIKEIEVIQYVDREVIKEVPVEIIKEKIVNIIQEVPVEKIVYIYDKKEEDVVTNIVNNCDKMEEIIFQKEQEILEINQKFSTKMEEQSNNFQKEKNELLLKIQQFENQEGQGNKEKMLQQTLVNLKKELTLSSEKIKEIETINEQLKTQQPIGAVYMKSSNLNEK